MLCCCAAEVEQGERATLPESRIRFQNCCSYRGHLIGQCSTWNVFASALRAGSPRSAGPLGSTSSAKHPRGWTPPITATQGKSGQIRRRDSDQEESRLLYFCDDKQRTSLPTGGPSLSLQTPPLVSVVAGTCRLSWTGVRLPGKVNT